MADAKHPDLSGPEFAHLGHFRKPEFVAMGHNVMTKEEEEQLVREAQEHVAKNPISPTAPAPSTIPELKEKKDPGKAMEEAIKARNDALRRLGIHRSQ